MDGINRYFQPNTLDGLSIYDNILPGEPLYVDGSNAMQADADMGNHNVKNVATATANDEAVNLGQVNLALASKADTSYVNAQDNLRVLKAGDTMTGNLSMNFNKITSLAAGAVVGEAVEYAQLNAVQNLALARVLKSGDTMTGNLAMSNFKVTGLAAATSNGEAVRYEQLTSLDTNVVHKTGNETISGVKTFTTLPETTLTATTANQLVNRATALSYVPFDNFGLVHFTTGRNTPVTYGRLFACNIGTFNSPLVQRNYDRTRIYGTTVTLIPRITYYGCVIRSIQSFTFPPATYGGATVQIGIYSVDNANMLAVTNIQECVDTTVAVNGQYRNHYVGFQSPFTPSTTDTYIVAICIAGSPDPNWGFLGSDQNNGDIWQVNLNTVAGLPLKTHQKGWVSTANGFGSLPGSINIDCNTSSSIWVGLTGLPDNFS